MNIIQSVSTKKFTLNGITYLKNYISRIAGNKVIVFNNYDNKDVLIEWTNYADFTVNGVAYASAALLQQALNDVLFYSLVLDGTGDTGAKEWTYYFTHKTTFIDRFLNATTIQAIDYTGVASLSYSLNLGNTYTNVPLPLATPLDLPANTWVKWKIVFTAGSVEAALHIKRQ